MKNIAVVAATFTGNRGAEAMLLTVIEQVHRAYPDCKIHVLSYAADEDIKDFKERDIPNVYIHSCSPLSLVISWLPLSLLGWLILALKKNPTGDHKQSPLALLSVDKLIDLAGVSFIDGREKFLPFNVLTILPFILSGVPVYKLSQAIGPIRSRLNRLAAKLILPRCELVVARGSTTFKYLKEFGLKAPKLQYAPDVSFLLAPEGEIPTDFTDRHFDIGFVPSSVVLKKYPAYEQKLVEVIQALVGSGHKVSLVLHSWKEGTEKSFNNDLPLAKRIASQIAVKDQLPIIGVGLNARELKGHIANHKLLVTSRFHAMIAALDTETPPLVLGWSHKYKEVLEEFGLADQAFGYQNTSVDEIVDRVESDLKAAESLSPLIRDRLGAVRLESARQLSLVDSKLGVDDRIDPVEHVGVPISP